MLQVQPDAPPEVIKASYRTLMQKLRHHPDLGGDQWNAAVINEAYAVLSNPPKRAAYDVTQPHLFKNIGSSARDEGVSAPPPPPPEPEPTRQPEAEPDVIEATPPKAAPGAPACPFCGSALPAGGYRHLEWCGRCHATLNPVVPSANTTGRTANRIEHVADMQFVLSWPPKQHYVAKVVDLSPTGMQFVSRQLLRTKQRLLIESATLSAVAVVRRCAVSAYAPVYETGVKFITLNMHQRSGTFFSKSA